jgi:hypothetical protein
MTRRLTVAAAALVALPVVAVWTHDAGAFTTAKRLCVSSARKTLKNTLSTTKVQAANTYQASLRTCFSDPGGGCVDQCFTAETSCQIGDPVHNNPGPKTLQDTCSTTVDPNDGVVSCVEQADLDQAKCCLNDGTAATQGCSITPTGNFNTDAAAQLACAETVRLARFNCQQDCASKYKQALDACTTTFNDCLEGCG